METFVIKGVFHFRKSKRLCEMWWGSSSNLELQGSFSFTSFIRLQFVRWNDQSFTFNSHVCLRSRMKWRPMRNLSFILLRGKQLLLVIFRPNSSLVEKLYVSFSLGRISAVVKQDKRPMEARSTRTVTLVGTFFWKDSWMAEDWSPNQAPTLEDEDLTALRQVQSRDRK